MWQLNSSYRTCTHILENPDSCTTHSTFFQLYWFCHKLRSLSERSQRGPPPVLRSDNVHTSSWLYTQQFNTCRLLLLLPRVFAAQTAQESCVYRGFRVVHRLIGSTHGLGWVGSDWVEIFFSVFSELGWVVARKKWICPLVLTNFDTLAPQNSENWINHQNFFTFLQLCQIWHKFDTRGKGYCTKLVGKWVKYNENYLFAGYGDNGFRHYLCISCIC